MNSLVRIAAASSKRVANYRAAAVACNNIQVCRFATEKVPEEDYYDGHLMADRLEYLDDMLEKTLSIEMGLDNLKETYAKKRSAVMQQATDAASTAELEALFEKAAAQKGELSSQIAILKASLINAKEAYAVDSPDGVPDDELKRGLKEVDQIIEFARDHEDVEKIKKQHEMEAAVKKERARDPEHDW